ncbi:hypothetical protein GCM10023219_05270 [Stakelama sediminis]|uniref:Flp pilus assembly protein TadD n=1 Tax=Stakelama sediminis TaxID=463200 RepID=A0A840YUD1_9SPHN|nr:SPOR domain-containing protein [Stakelama sediminis]MBB5717243.1 Flp pilus assembly protein TadD [Stakelama sediminis]
MKTRTALMFGISALLLGGTMVGCSATHNMLASAGTVKPDSRKAQKSADKAGEALAKHDNDKAVRYAEQAVATAPQNAAYRALLGQSYLHDGRFASAEQALQDTLSLNPDNGRAALNLALAQTALGHWDDARATLNSHQNQIAPADRGLALALAGDPKGAVEILAKVARQPNANATARQNLALALALAGHWREARAIAAVDVAPGEIDDRIAQWAAFARPTHAYDQVASLLGVKSVGADAGQPVQLALKDSDTKLAAVAPIAPVASATPDADTAPAETDTQVAEAAAVPARAPQQVAQAAPVMPMAAQGPAVSFAPPREVAQAIPAHMVRKAAAQAAPKQAVAVRKAPEKAPTLSAGNYYVQLGAYENAAVAKEKWHRISRRNQRLASLTPSGMEAKVNGQSFYRLSVGGFARNDAVSLCRSVKANGGRCFVRADAGYQTANWVANKNIQLASR